MTPLKSKSWLILCYMNFTSIKKSTCLLIWGKGKTGHENEGKLALGIWNPYQDIKFKATETWWERLKQPWLWRKETKGLKGKTALTEGESQDSCPIQQRISGAIGGDQASVQLMLPLHQHPRHQEENGYVPTQQKFILSTNTYWVSP